VDDFEELKLDTHTWSVHVVEIITEIFRIFSDEVGTVTWKGKKPDATSIDKIDKDCI
jgi:hypothetical protein